MSLTTVPLTDAQVDAQPVALARIFVGVAYVVCLLEVVLVLQAVADGKLAFPVFETLPPASAGLVSVLTMVGLLAGVLLVLGILSTMAALTCFLVLVTAQLLDQQVYSNHLVLCTLLLAFLALARAGSRWSVDARLRGGREVVPWWPQLLMMTQVSICYLFAGLSKINPRFLSGETLPESLWLEAPHGVFRALAVATICTEVFIALGLWRRRTRVLAVLAGAALHAGILVLFDGGWLQLGAFGLLCAGTYWMFLVRPAFARGGTGLEVVVRAPSRRPRVGTAAAESRG